MIITGNSFGILVCAILILIYFIVKIKYRIESYKFGKLFLTGFLILVSGLALLYINELVNQAANGVMLILGNVIAYGIGVPILATTIYLSLIDYHNKTVELERRIEREKVLLQESKKANEKLYNLFINLNAVIFQVDVNGIVLLYEGKGTKKTRRSSGEYVGRSVYDIYRDKPSIIANIKKSFTGEELTFEAEVDDIIFEVYFSPLVDENGNLEGGLCIATDITARKAIEIELEKTKESFLEAQKIAKMGNWEDDMKIHSVEWSDEIFRIFGYEPKEFKPEAKTVLDFSVPEDKEYLMKKMKQSLVQNGANFEHRVFKKDGSIIWIKAITKPQFDDDGKIVIMRGIIQDITESKLLEEKLKESKEKYKGLTDKVPVGILSYDKNGNLLFVNPKVVEILGSPSIEATMAINLFNFKPLIESGITNVFKEVIEKGNFVNLEREYISKWEKKALIRLQVSPVKDERDNVESAVAILEDFTDRKEMEMELRIAKERAEASNRAKSEFLANMSHEIRTPMNGIIGMTDLTLLSDLNELQRDNLEIVKTSANSLLRIINDILDYSKIEAGKVEIENKPFSVKQLAEEVESFFRVVITQKNINFIMEIGKEIPLMISGDSIRLRQVLVNLIGNALKFTDKGRVFINIEYLEMKSNKHTVKFTVSDTGIGISQENMHKLFKSFSQADSSTTRRYGGTGLGLIICRRLVNLMGGEIWAQSREGEGSSFYFTAEFGAVNDKSDIPEKNDQIVVMDRFKNDNKVILVVEDDDVSRKLSIAALVKKGFEVLSVSNGKDAVKIFSINKIDLIFMDINMPIMDGYTATSNIRQLEYSVSSRVPIIAMTAYALKGDREKCIESGMDDYISKPIDIYKLYEIVEKWI